MKFWNWIIGKIALSAVLIGLAAPAMAQGKESKSLSSSSQSQEVKFDGHGVQLSGTLVAPKLDAGKRVPGVLIIVATGQTPRDGITFGKATHPIYRDIAEYLAARGMVTLRYDKRCAGASECKAAESFNDYVDDAQGALNFLRKQEQVDPSRIFLFGHGEGATIAASIAGQEKEKPAGVILAAMPGRTLGKVIRDQIQNRMKEAGKPESEMKAFLAKYDRVVGGMADGKIEFPEVKLSSKDPDEAILLGMIRRHQVIVSQLVNDPLEIAAGVKAPILILQGKKDTQIAVKDAQFIAEALSRVYHPDVTLRLFDDVDHLLKTNQGAATLASLEDVSRPLDPALLKVLAEWLEKRSNPVKMAADKQ